MRPVRLFALAFALALLAPPAAGAECAAPALPRAALEARVAEVLRAQAATPYEGVDAELVGAVPATLATAPVVTVRSAWPAARVAVQLEWEACGEARRQLAWFKARAWRQAWVYGRDAGADTPLAAAQPARRLLDMAQWRQPEAELAEAADDAWLARPVRAGAPLRRDDLKPAPLVARNARVTVLVQGRGLQLRAAGTALQFGAAQEWIAVMVDGTDKSMRARVVAPGVVHVEI